MCWKYSQRQRCCTRLGRVLPRRREDRNRANSRTVLGYLLGRFSGTRLRDVVNNEQGSSSQILQESSQLSFKVPPHLAKPSEIRDCRIEIFEHTPEFLFERTRGRVDPKDTSWVVSRSVPVDILDRKLRLPTTGSS